jgi:hypothetical protein
MILRQRDHRKLVKFHGHEFALMLLPVFSLSHPDRLGNSRLVFDWGKSLSHPRAQIAVGILSSPFSQYVKRLIYRGNEYGVSNLRKCRSGRMAARVYNLGRAKKEDIQLIDRLMKQELGDE